MSAIVLASASPRRRELLARLGFETRVAPADIDEALRRGERPLTGARRLAREKAEVVATRLGDTVWVLAADTLVVDPRGRVLGKPRDRAEAIRFLLRLGGQVHRVVTGVAVIAPGGRLRVAAASAAVRFRPITRATAVAYVATGEADDKAGAYALQGRAAIFVERMWGDPTTVVGLPLHLAVRLLAEAGAPLPQLPAAAVGTKPPPRPSPIATR